MSIVSEKTANLQILLRTLVRNDELDISLRQMAVLTTVGAWPGSAIPSVKDVAEHLDLFKPAVTRALDMLETAKLVTREPHAADRRMVDLKVTKEGRTFLNRSVHLITRALQAAELRKNPLPTAPRPRKTAGAPAMAAAA